MENKLFASTLCPRWCYHQRAYMLLARLKGNWQVGHKTNKSANSIKGACLDVIYHRRVKQG